jgi:hypothetical protein
MGGGCTGFDRTQMQYYFVLQHDGVKSGAAIAVLTYAGLNIAVLWAK